MGYLKKICIFGLFQQLTTSVRCMMLMQGTHMPVPTTKPANWFLLNVRPLLWLQATRVCLESTPLNKELSAV